MTQPSSTQAPGTQRTVIVGSGIGGIRTAQALRTLGYAGEVVVVGQEPEPPYDRPPLSKEFLAGRHEAEGVSLLSHQEAAATGITLRLGVTAERIVPEDKCLVLDNGETLAYDVCVVATGTSARPSPWDKLDGVHSLRSLAHGHALRGQLQAGREVAVIGGGFIGSEVAATARSLGLGVTVIDPLPLPLSRTLGTTVAQLVVDLHHRHGVSTVFGAGVESIENSGLRLNLKLSTGATLAADAVVVGIGAVPNDEWLGGSGLPVDDGLLCDEYCRVQGRDDIFGVGDVVRWYSPRHDGHVRVEHWTNAVDQARCVAHNITFPDQPTAYEGIEYVWSDQYDWKIQVAGRPVHHDITTEAMVGDFDAQRPRGAVLYGDSTGALVAAVTVNWPRAIALTRQALARHAPYAETLAAVGGTRRLPGTLAGVHYCQSCDTPVVMEPRGGHAVCPRCGRADDTVRGPLFVVTGASGSGKTIAHGVAQSGLPTVLLGPFIPDHLRDLPARRWTGDIHFLVLDCPDELRRDRINARPPWRSRDLDEQVEFGRWLRRSIPDQVDTSRGTPDDTADVVVRDGGFLYGQT